MLGRRPVLIVEGAQGLRWEKVERIPEVLQLAIVVEGSRSPALEPEPPDKRDLRRGCRPAQGRILKECREARLLRE